MIKIKIAEIFRHRNETTFRPYLMAKDIFKDVGIEFVFDQTQLDLLLKKNPYPCVVQEFVPNVGVEGDLRVLTFRGQVLGQLLRIPKEGSLLANLFQGGSAVWRELSSTERAVSIHVSKKLESMGIYLAGIDFLGAKISEINITSPTGFSQASYLSSENITKKMISGLEINNFANKSPGFNTSFSLISNF